MESFAFYEGLDAFRDGKKEDQNPYNLDEEEEQHLHWKEGWVFGAGGEL